VKVPRAVIGGAQPTGMEKKLWRLSLGTYYLLVTGILRDATGEGRYESKINSHESSSVHQHIAQQYLIVILVDWKTLLEHSLRERDGEREEDQGKRERGGEISPRNCEQG
jgi:hypothetical protein